MCWSSEDSSRERKKREERQIAVFFFSFRSNRQRQRYSSAAQTPLAAYAQMPPAAVHTMGWIIQRQQRKQAAGVAIVSMPCAWSAGLPGSLLPVRIKLNHRKLQGDGLCSYPQTNPPPPPPFSLFRSHHLSRISFTRRLRSKRPILARVLSAKEK